LPTAKNELQSIFRDGITLRNAVLYQSKYFSRQTMRPRFYDTN
jgi:hypothetical protein